MSKKESRTFVVKKTKEMKRTIQLKTIINCIVFLLVMYCMSGCGKNSQTVEDEMLTEPEYETKSIVQKTETVQLYDGWARMDSMFEGVEYVYYPYVENKVKGVSYIEDCYESSADDVTVFKNINCPVGCKSLKHTASCENQWLFQPELEGAFTEGIKTNPLIAVEDGEDVSDTGNSIVNGVYDRTIVEKHEILRQDVQAVSFALYEDFFDDIPELTVKLYGIPVTLWEKELGNKMEFSSKQYQEFTEKYYGTLENRYQDNNLNAFDLLAEKKIEKTGVYYIDYNDLYEKGDYIRIVVVLNFNKSAPYTYRMCGNGVYDVSDRAAYEEWKNKNMDLFIQ